MNYLFNELSLLLYMQTKIVYCIYYRLRYVLAQSDF